MVGLGWKFRIIDLKFISRVLGEVLYGCRVLLLNVVGLFVGSLKLLWLSIMLFSIICIFWFCRVMKVFWMCLSISLGLLLLCMYRLLCNMFLLILLLVKKCVV